MNVCNILLVDDFAPWRNQIRLLLKAYPEWNIIGESSDGLDGIAKAIEMQPDLVLLDIGMPSLNGIEAAKIIRQRCPKSKILFVTEDDDHEVRAAALQAGAVGYILKRDAGNRLAGAIARAFDR